MALTLINCKKAEPCEETILPKLQQYTFLEPRRYLARLQNVDATASQVNLVIRSQQDYEKYILIQSDTIRPVIDFSKRMLLAGQILRSTSAGVSSMDISTNCHGYTFNVTTHQGNLGVVQFVPYYVVCDITYLPIQFNILGD
jgi:hypothetical protein